MRGSCSVAARVGSSVPGGAGDLRMAGAPALLRSGDAVTWGLWHMPDSCVTEPIPTDGQPVPLGLRGAGVGCSSTRGEGAGPPGSRWASRVGWIASRCRLRGADWSFFMCRLGGDRWRTPVVRRRSRWPTRPTARRPWRLVRGWSVWGTWNSEPVGRPSHYRGSRQRAVSAGSSFVCLRGNSVTPAARFSRSSSRGPSLKVGPAVSRSRCVL